MVHRARQGVVGQRTATLNRIRALPDEVGIALPLRADAARTQAAALLEESPGWVNTVVGDLRSEVHRLDGRLRRYEPQLMMFERRRHWHAVVAIAAKNARMAWAVLRCGENFVMSCCLTKGEALVVRANRRERRQATSAGTATTLRLARARLTLPCCSESGVERGVGLGGRARRQLLAY